MVGQVPISEQEKNQIYITQHKKMVSRENVGIMKWVCRGVVDLSIVRDNRERDTRKEELNLK
jgi:hypothetical protein